MTTETGRFNLIQGFIGTVIAIAAAISTGTTGFLFEKIRSSGWIFNPQRSSGCHYPPILGWLPKQSPVSRLKASKLSGCLLLFMWKIERPNSGRSMSNDIFQVVHRFLMPSALLVFGGNIL